MRLHRLPGVQVGVARARQGLAQTVSVTFLANAITATLDLLFVLTVAYAAVWLWGKINS